MTVEPVQRPLTPRHLVIAWLAALYAETGDYGAALMAVDELQSWLVLMAGRKGIN